MGRGGAQGPALSGFLSLAVQKIEGGAQKEGVWHLDNISDQVMFFGVIVFCLLCCAFVYTRHYLIIDKLHNYL